MLYSGRFILIESVCFCRINSTYNCLFIKIELKSEFYVLIKSVNYCVYVDNSSAAANVAAGNTTSTPSCRGQPKDFIMAGNLPDSYNEH